MTEIQVDDSGTWRDIRYQSYEIEFGLSDVLLAPKATVQSDAREDIDAGQRLRIRESGSTIFEGRTTSSGKRRNNGRRRVEVEHRAFELFDETVSFTETSPTAGDVLQRALDESSIGGSFTLTFAATDVTLADDYEADDRTVKRVFRDMTDRAGLVWWVDGVDDEITVDEYGARGVWESINTETDAASVLEFDPDSLDTVVNDVTVNGTGGERVTGSASDSGSIDEFGRRPKTLNVSYIQSDGEADDYADALLQPDPLPEADVQIGRRVGDVFENLANFEIDITDPSTGLDDTLVVEKQTVSQGSAEVALGQGRAVQIEQFNRAEKSKGDTTEPGSVYGGDRIADEAIDEPKLVDLSVTEQKLADLSVSLDKVQPDSIDTVNITDDAIETPKLAAGSVVASKIQSDTITANEIDAGTITAVEIATGTLTANEIDTLELTAGELTVADDIDDPSTGFTVDFDETGGDISLVPLEDEGARIGVLGGPRMVGVHTLLTTFSTGIIDDGGVVRPSSEGSADLGTSTFPWGETVTEDIQIQRDSSEPIVSALTSVGTALRPENDNQCRLGTSEGAYASVEAHNFVEATPEPLEDIDASDITGYSWYNPPECVAQRKADADSDRDYEHHNPNDGIELGHMVNYLFEVCKDQERTIESLESSLSDLEQRVSELE